MLLGIDATNWIHQLWHANRGQDVLDHALSRLQLLIDRIRPTATVCCFDRRSFRHDLLPTYKSGRGPRDAALVRVLEEAPAQFGRNAAIAMQDGFEADDGLATLAAVGVANGDRVVLASPDKDLRQCLVMKQVTILRGFRTCRGEVLDEDWFTTTDLLQKYGLTPAQWPAFQALVGDRSDAIPGAEGWGEKSVLAALKACSSLDGVLRRATQIHLVIKCSERQRQSLMAFASRADVVRQLVTLRTDMEAVFDALR